MRTENISVAACKLFLSCLAHALLPLSQSSVGATPLERGLRAGLEGEIFLKNSRLFGSILKIAGRASCLVLGSMLAPLLASEIQSFRTLSDDQLAARFGDLLIEDQERLVLKLESILEMDRRKLFFESSSIWSCLVEKYCMEDYQAERLIRAARLMRRFPWIRDQLANGKLNLSLLEIAQGVAHREKLSDDELAQTLRQIAGMSCRKAKRELAALYPQSVQGFHDRIRPINEEFSEVRFVASQELLDRLEEIKGMLAHSHPGIGLAELIEVLASEYRERHHPEAKARRAEKRERAREEKRASSSEQQAQVGQLHEQSPTAPWVVRREEDRRHPSPSLLRALIRRDGYQCAHVDEKTRKRCGSRYGLEADHYPVPWSLGGKSELSNLRFVCPGHHARATFLVFGDPRERMA